MQIYFVNSLIRMFFMNLSIVYVFIKIKYCNNINIFLLLLVNIFTGIIFSWFYCILKTFISPIYINIIGYIFCSLFSAMILNELDDKLLVTMLFSILISFTTFFISTIIPFFTKQLFESQKYCNETIEYFIIGIMQFVLVYQIFRIKRLKNGFAFLKENRFTRIINFMEIILGLIAVVYITFGIAINIIFRRFLFVCIVLGMSFIIYAIKHSITKHYKLKMKDRTVEILQEQIAKKDVEIANLKDELAGIHKINHKYNHRISAMEKAISNLEFNEEFAKEHGEIIELVKQLSEEYKTELNSLQKNSIKTGNTGVDNILEYMRQKAINNNIEFNMKTETNIKEFENHIENNRLETFLADHINDAIIAIKFSSNKTRKILVTFQKINKNCAIKIYDTGIEFEIDTLTKLGTQSVTTHKETRRKRNRIYDNI